MLKYNDSSIETGMVSLENKGYSIVDDFLSIDECQHLLAYFKYLQEENALKKAGIGSGLDYKKEYSIRGDEIFWLDETIIQQEPFLSIFNKIDCWADAYKNYFRVPIQGREFHLATYPKGTFYKRHLDQFSHRNNRLLSMIMYLNTDWKTTDGGELELYLPEEKTLQIEPLLGRMVLFHSHLIEHAVLMTHAQRYSLTGWLLRKPTDIGFLDQVH